MRESVEDFMARKHQEGWQKRYRRALSGFIPVGLVLPGEQRRNSNGKFARKVG